MVPLYGGRRMEPLSVAMRIWKGGTSMKNDRRVRLHDDELLYLRGLVVEDIISRYKKKGWKKQEREHALLLEKLTHAIGGGRAGRHSTPYYFEREEFFELRKLPPYVEKRLSELVED